MPTAAYIGTLAHLAPMEFVSGERVVQGGRYSVQQAARSSWAFVARGADRPPARSWSVTATMDGESFSYMQDVAIGAFGNGPFICMPESAYVSNALTPAQSALPNLSGPEISTPDGWAPRSALGPGEGTLASRVPVLPGQPVTVSAYASGGADLKAVFRNLAGSVISSPTVSSSGTSMQRLHYTTNAAPSTARTVDVVVSGHTAATRPQVTWTRKLTPWAPGQGSASVIVSKFEASPLLLDGGINLYRKVDFELEEVGI